ncbi:aromatic prenyltransferase [Xylariomycetidae sp. FL2044]|nr:aromatic prenyltransferase [Xylariomycetidae sp. FL2044]
MAAVSAGTRHALLPRQLESLSPSEASDHQILWNKHVGGALEVLLANAGYSMEARRRSLDFFNNLIAPNLGLFKGPNPNANDKNPNSWQSFMTDDGTPVELGWDWGTTDKSQPTIRYSMEPIGLQAGSPVDPVNSLAGAALLKQLKQTLPEINLERFDYFTKYFNFEEQHSSHDVQDHQSSVFYGFDITETDPMGKVYFFPQRRARQYGQSTLEAVAQGIKGTPGATDENLQALSMFLDFTGDTSTNRRLECEILAIDLIHPSESRFKIYFRSRETTFRSVADIMTLGGRIRTPTMETGLSHLRSLWTSVFEVNALGTLAENTHRTAGMMYNVEFRLGDERPVAKVYLPVRHYSSSDKAVMQGLGDYFESVQRARHTPAFERAMNDLFGSGTLTTQAGAHTYIGCAIRPTGDLRVVSYLKPQLCEPVVEAMKGV